MFKLFNFFFICGLFAGFVGCAEETVDHGEVLQSAQTRDESPDVSVEDQGELVDGNSAFAFDLYHNLADDADGNVFCSPYSISSALAMTYAGARGETAIQMSETLHFTLADEQLHPAFNWLDLTLEERGESGGFELEVANAIWGQRDYPFLESFLDTLAINYGAGLRTLDFGADPEAARLSINDWVEEQTHDRIKDLIPSGAISVLTRLVLTNAIYFKADWARPFEANSTYDRIFTLLDETEIRVPTMNQIATFGYAASDAYQAVEMLYEGETTSMVVILPAEGTFQEFEDALDNEGIAEIVDALEPTEVDLAIPRFTFESAFVLNDSLVALGMTDAFDGTAADFTGIEETGELFISRVIHKAFVAVDEEGTEAAAATAVIMDGNAAEPTGEEMYVDRPFIFLIREVETGAILFLGRVLDPR